MSSGPLGKGPRLWLQPERKNANGSVEAARWVIRDGSLKRSTGLPPHDIEGAERALQHYIAEKHDPRRHDGDPDRVLIVDVLRRTLCLSMLAPGKLYPASGGLLPGGVIHATL